MVAVQGVGAEGVEKPVVSRSSDVGCGSGATDFRCPRHVRYATDGDRMAAPHQVMQRVNRVISGAA